MTTYVNISRFRSSTRKAANTQIPSLHSVGNEKLMLGRVNNDIRSSEAYGSANKTTYGC
jgi:hypothetical protein